MSRGTKVVAPDIERCNKQWGTENCTVTAFQKNMSRGKIRARPASLVSKEFNKTCCIVLLAFAPYVLFLDISSYTF